MGPKFFGHLFHFFFFSIFYYSFTFANSETKAIPTYDDLQNSYIESDFKAVINKGELLLKNSGTDIDVLLILARAYHIEGQNKKAWSLIKKSLALEKSTYVYETAADLFFWEENHKESLRYYQLALKNLKKSDPVILAKIGREQLLTGNQVEGKKIIDEIEGKYGDKYQDIYNLQQPNKRNLNQQLELEAGLGEIESDSPKERTIALSYNNKNPYIDFGLGVTRLRRYREVGWQFQLNLYKDFLSFGKNSYINLNASRSNEKVYSDYSVGANYFVTLIDPLEFSLGYSYSDYGQINNNIYRFGMSAYFSQWASFFNFYWSPTNFDQKSKSASLRLALSFLSDWEFSPSLSGGSEVNEVNSTRYVVIDFIQVGHKLTYFINQEFSLFHDVWWREEKFDYGKQRASWYLGLGLTHNF